MPTKLKLVKQPGKKRSLDQAAAEMFGILEEHFDELGLSEAQRDERYAHAERRVSAFNVVPTIAASAE